MRHTAVDVPQGVCYGQTDVPLKPTFETEATKRQPILQGLSFDKVYTSPLTRCVRLPFAATRCRTGRPLERTKLRRLGNASVR